MLNHMADDPQRALVPKEAKPESENRVDRIDSLIEDIVDRLELRAGAPKALHRVPKDVALQILATEKERALMDKEVALERIAATERGQTRLLWFSAYALVVIAAIVTALAYLGQGGVAGVVVGSIMTGIAGLLGHRLVQKNPEKQPRGIPAPGTQAGSDGP
jgi:hypothetical protein